MEKIAFIGLGEAGGAIVEGWGSSHSSDIIAYDIKTERPSSAPCMIEKYTKLGITGASCPAEAVQNAEIVFSTVTADQAVCAAEAAAPYLRAGVFWCDLNSCAPPSKRKAAEIVEGVGGRYVDVAVMSTIYPKRNLTPLLISGPHANDIEPILRALPMAPRVLPGGIGKASSVKMIRSVFVKGLEALTSECLLAAVSAGVEDEVLNSLSVSHAGINWNEKAAYNFERAMVHGVRRATELEEVGNTLLDLGLPNDMVHAAANWQRRLAEIDVEAPKKPMALGARAVAEMLLPGLIVK